MPFSLSFKDYVQFKLKSGETVVGLSKSCDVFSIVMPECVKGEFCNEELFDAFRELDELKRRCNMPVTTLLELQERADRSEEPSELLSFLINLDENYAILKQFRVYTALIAWEMESLNNQLNIRFKMRTNQQLTPEEKKAYVELDMRDFNELLRFIYVWDLQHSFVPRYHSIVQVDSFRKIFVEDEEFRKKLSSAELEPNGAWNNDCYMKNLEYYFLVKDAFYKNWAEIKQACEKMQEHWRILTDNIDKLNTMANYKHIHRTDYDDKSRAPIDTAYDKEFVDEDYQRRFTEYKNECRARKDYKSADYYYEGR